MVKTAIANIDRFAATLARGVIRWRYVVILLCFAVTGLVAMNAVNLGIATNYRVFFSSDNPELNAFENFQATYTKNDNFLFVLNPKIGGAFTPTTLDAVEKLTKEAWQIPFTIRVDSITNFQATSAIDDDLLVEDLIINGLDMGADALKEKQIIALAEPILRGQLLTHDAEVTAINVVLQYPDKAVDEVNIAAASARALRDLIEKEHPDIDVTLTGVSMLNNAFAEAGIGDMSTLIPLMYLVILITCVLAARTISGTVATLFVITTSVMVAMGAGGIANILLNPISLVAPTIIMTLAVADSVHILISMRAAMRRGMNKIDALVEAIRINFLAVTITSLTTIVGFLTLNFSDAPPFWHLGNMTAVGIFSAWVFSLTLLPAIVSLLPVRGPSQITETSERSTMVRFADWVIYHYKMLLVVTVIGSVALIAMIPTIQFNDQWVEYFDERVEFRTESDIALKHFGIYPIEFSVPAGEAGAVADPDFLKRLDSFTQWLREQPNVTHVYSLTDIMKRLNKNMHGDDETWFKLPEDRELSAQYLLLYELSLPYGLDLNDRINIDKSATRVTATLGNITTLETKEFLNAAEAFIVETFHENQRAKPTSAQVMFTYITDRNVQNMILGTIIAIIAISLIMIVSLQSLPLGLLSLIPNALPILTTFGLWAILVGEVGFSVASVASISLGIIVDDTVHFLTKYQRVRKEKNLDVEDAIRYVFDTVGGALIANTVILGLGFLVLTYSTFKVNVDMGLMTLIAIIFALILDFFLLPALLLLGRKRDVAKPAAASPVALP